MWFSDGYKEKMFIKMALCFLHGGELSGGFNACTMQYVFGYRREAWGDNGILVYFNRNEIWTGENCARMVADRIMDYQWDVGL